MRGKERTYDITNYDRNKGKTTVKDNSKGVINEDAIIELVMVTSKENL